MKNQITKLIDQIDPNSIKCDKCKKYFQKEFIFNFIITGGRIYKIKMDAITLCEKCSLNMKKKGIDLFPI
jgi:hypothetical protein